MSEEKLVPSEIIESRIFIIRDKKVMIDRDLAQLYGVETRALNQAVKRNIKRFPPDFMFSLTRKEITNLSQIVIGSKIKHAPNVFAFTQEGVAMLSGILNSDRAIKVNIQIMRTFTKLREIIITHKDLEQKINEIISVYGGKLKDHDQQIKSIFAAIEQLLAPPTEKEKKRYGFLAEKNS